MAYLYKKLVKGKPYYYLRVSRRVKGRIIAKDIAYLGRDVNKLEDKLDELPDKYKKEIKKTYENIKKFIESEYYLKKIESKKLKSSPYLSKELLEEIESIKLHFNKRFLKLDKATINDFYKEFLIDFAFNTTSLEGNTITLEEADRLLKENRTPKDRTLREVYDLQNTEKVFFEIIGSNKKLDHNFIINVHDKLMDNIDAREGYRIGETRIFRSRFKTSPARYIKTDMGLLLKWYEKNKGKLHPLVLVSIFHHKFEKIHPFADGNGRTGRMLMNYILLKNKWPPIIVKKSRRDEYLDAMAEADDSGSNDFSPKDYKKLVEFLAEELAMSYWNSFLV